MKGLAFHCHHDTLYEYVHDYDERVQFIKVNKVKPEQELRLRLFKMIPEDRIPGKDSWEWSNYSEARDACDKVEDIYNKAIDAYHRAEATNTKARDVYFKAGRDYDKARTTCHRVEGVYFSVYRKQLKELHKELCPDCPWDGDNIFDGH